MKKIQHTCYIRLIRLFSLLFLFASFQVGTTKDQSIHTVTAQQATVHGTYVDLTVNRQTKTYRLLYNKQDQYPTIHGNQFHIHHKMASESKEQLINSLQALYHFNIFLWLVSIIRLMVSISLMIMHRRYHHG